MKTKPLSFLILFVLISFIPGNCAFSEIVPGDLTRDFKVDIEDLLKFATVWLNDRGLVGYWKFDGNELDSSQYEHYSFLKGTYSWSEEGYFDGALHLANAKGVVKTLYCFGISGTEPRTCAAWIKTSSNYNDIIGWGDTDLAGQRWLLTTRASGSIGVLRLAVKGGKIVGSTDVCDDVWHHVAAVFEDDGTPNVSDVKLYVDGVEEATTYVSQSIYTAYSNVLKIGFFGDYPFSGLIDEVRIYNTALSAEQITSISTACAGAGCSAGTDSLFDITSLSEISLHWLEEKGPVVISEIMAENDDTLEDEDGDNSDWIEIHNPTNSTVSLDGWYLTDNSGSLRKWGFPDGLNLAPDEYKVIFASGKNRSDPNYLHTNFKLDNDGEYLALVRPDEGTGSIAVAHAYDPNFPKQYEDISYGIWFNEESYFPVASPGTANLCGMSGYGGVSEKPVFSHTGGIITDAFSLELSTTSPNAQIHYTLDNSTPFGTSDIYSGPIPINITSTTIVRAQVIEPGKVPSPRVTNIYIPVTTDVANFNSNIPVAIVDTAGYDIDTENNPSVFYPYRPVSAIFIDTDGTGRATVNGEIDFIGRGGIRVRGHSSASDWSLTNWPKKQYSFETWDDFDEDKNVSILDLPSESDWVLQAPYSDKTLMRNVLAYKWSNDIGQYATRTRFFELFLNTNGDNVSMSDYWGVYVLIEKIKRDDDRVDIAKLEPDHDSEPEITGGYILKVDRLDPCDVGFLTSINGGDSWTIFVEPDGDEITSAQSAWIQNYISEFETVLYGSGFADPVNGYAKYIDIDSFIDHHIIVEMMKNVDGYRLSTYMHKDRGEKLKMGPIWDYNLTLGNAYGWYYPLSYAKANSWYYPNAGVAHNWYNRLRLDPEYTIRYADRWWQFREKALSDEKVLADIDYYFNLLNAESAGRNFSQWDIIGEYIWPNYYYWASSYQDEVEWIKTWLAGNGSSPGDFSDHLDWFDNNVGSSEPPVIYINGTPENTGGTISSGDALSLSASSGTIYYTLDGSDPRLPGGSVNPGALIFGGGSIILTENTQTKTRSKNGSSWSALNEATFIVPTLFINEFMADNDITITDPQGQYDDWIEIYNSDSSAFNIGGMYLEDNNDRWQIPDDRPGETTISPGGYLLIWADNDDGDTPGLHANFALSAGGDQIHLYDTDGSNELDSIVFGAQNPDESFGRYPDGADSWGTHTTPTPGTSNSPHTP